MPQAFRSPADGRVMRTLIAMAMLLGGCDFDDPCAPLMTQAIEETFGPEGFDLRTPEASTQCHAKMEISYRWPDGHTPLPKGVYGGPGDDIGMEFGVSVGLIGGVYPVGKPSQYIDADGVTWLRAVVDQGAKDQTSPGRYYIS